jgi:bifunctional non-homologous end joining protein LigD
MLATSAPPPTGERWAMEIKWDGIRAQLRIDNRTLCLRSRPGRDCTGEFPELAVIAEQLDGRQVILDGELVCFGADAKPDSLRCAPGSGGGRGAWELPRLAAWSSSWRSTCST